MLRFVLLLCGFTTTAGSLGAGEPAAAKAIRALIPEAASCPNKVLEDLARSDNPDPRHLPVSLTTLVLALHPEKDEDEKVLQQKLRDINVLALNPAKLADAVSRSKAKGYSTIIQPEYITTVTCHVKNSTATGEVHYKAEGIYQGRVEYTARQDAQGWRITELRLPGHRIRLARLPDGKWQRSSIEDKK